MPSAPNETASMLRDLQDRLERLVEAARNEGREEALHKLRAMFGGGPETAPVRRGPGRPRGSRNKPKDDGEPKPTKARKNSWSGMTPEAKLARINAIRKGRGLPLKETL